MGDFDVIYDATGRKWMQKSTTESLIYVGGMLFRDGNFASLQLADGRIFQDDQAQDVFTEYHHKDHLGNVRVAFVDYDGDGVINLTDANSGEVSQVNTYYPFGLVHPENCGPDGVVGNENRWTYNGKEHIDEVGLYDYGARYYDAAVGRWSAVDPLAEKYRWINPYGMVANNPLIFVDPNGMEIINAYEEYAQYVGKYKRLQNELEEAGNIESGKDRRKEKRRIRGELSSIRGGVENYLKVGDLIKEFRSAVGEDEFEVFNNMQFSDGQEIDVVVSLTSSDLAESADGITNSPFGRTGPPKYIIGVSENYQTGETSSYVAGIEGNSIPIKLFGRIGSGDQTVSTLANELADARFQVLRPNISIADMSRSYQDRRATVYSADYQEYVRQLLNGRNIDKPVLENYDK